MRKIQRTQGIRGVTHTVLTATNEENSSARSNTTLCRSHAHTTPLLSQVLLSFSHSRHPGGHACVISSWRVASAHLHSSRYRNLDLEGRRGANPWLGSEGSRCGRGSNQTCVVCAHAVSPAGHVHVECEYRPGNRMSARVPPLPRFGMSVQIARELGQARLASSGR